MTHPVVALVNEWARMESEHPGLSVEEFCVRYLTERSHATTHPTHKPMSINGILGSALGRLTRYVLMYTKKALAPMQLRSIDDMIYLHIIAEKGNPRKSEVIYEALSEFPSGIDVIRRLVKMGLVVESPAADDKRSKRLQLSAQGHTMMQATLKPMEKVGEAAFSTLSPVEKMLLKNILGRLDHFHAQRYKDTRQAENIEEIQEILLQKRDL